ncbi:MAG TPA: SPOR domain-containing protein [Chitinivibrionales bacterium]|nr:SPOR domain-containing protein [Chitinivibrionales bacterium]
MMTHFFRFTGVAMILIILNSNYAMSKRPQDDEAPARKIVLAANDKPAAETFLDTLNRGREITLSDKDFNPIIAETTAIAPGKDGAGSSEVPNGFRVQCFASSQIERVRAEQKNIEARVRFPVYIIFAAPYYKLLVGDFVKRADADAALVKMKELGYADAWVMRTKVWIKQ